VIIELFSLGVMVEALRSMAVASLKVAEGHWLWAEGHRSGCGIGVSPPAAGVRRSQPPEKYICNANSCIPVHSWVRKWATAEQRR